MRLGGVTLPFDLLELVGLSFFAFIILLLILYVVWNTAVKHRPPTFTIARDEAAVKNGDKTFDEVKKVVSSYLSVISGLTGLTFAGTLVVIALMLSVFDLTDDLRRIVLYLILGLLGTAAVCWLFALDQLTVMASGSIDEKRFFRFYRNITNLWFVGMVFIVVALVLFLFLVYPIIGMAVGLAALVIVVGYWNTNNDWFVPLSKGDRSSKAESRTQQ